MFTGLIEEVGRIKSVEEKADGKAFVIECSFILEDANIGDSICVDGACQTIEEFSKNDFRIFSIPETLAATNFADYEPGRAVNLERALKMGDRLGGHLVQGHVEGTGTVTRLEKDDNHWNVFCEYESAFIVPKGSVTLNGISLTIQKTEGNEFMVQIIPETLKKTNITEYDPGMRVNIETDYIVKALAHAQNWYKERG